MERLGWAAPYALAWQSKVGPARWLEPSVTEVLRRWSAEGVTRVVLVPVVFVSEHSETLYELDVLYAGQAREMGMEVKRVPTPRSARAFIEGLAGLVRRALGD
jgi:ferrochelatase